MNLRHLRLATVLSALFFTIALSAQDILITDTRSDAAVQLMDLNWKRASNLIGAHPEIINTTYLDSLHILKDADVVIIADAIKEVTPSQRNTLLQYVNAGGHVYVQSEFRINFSGNQLILILLHSLNT